MKRAEECSVKLENPTEKKEDPAPAQAPAIDLEKLAARQVSAQCKTCNHFRECAFLTSKGKKEAIPFPGGTPTCVKDPENIIFMVEHKGWLSYLDKGDGYICPGSCRNFMPKGA